MKIMKLVLAVMVFCLMISFSFGYEFITAIYYDEYPQEYDEVYFHVENNAHEKLENVKVRVSIPELDIYETTGSFDMKSGDSYSGFFYLDEYDNIPAGDYYIRYSVSNEDYRRTKYRLVTFG